MSRPVRGAWIEIHYGCYVPYILRSRPVRGAWIEITRKTDRITGVLVAPRKGRVD